MPGNSRQLLRRRIKGVRETSKVTRAMEMIASARMRRTEQRALEARPYATRMTHLMGLVSADAQVRLLHPYLQHQDSARALVVHFTTDKGLCGGLNSRLNHSLGAFVLEQPTPVDVVVVGKKGREFAVRARLGLVAEFTDLGDAPGIADLRPLCRLVTDRFSRGEVGCVYLAYPRFLSLMVQRPVVELCLPVAPAPAAVNAGQSFVYEPDTTRVLDALLIRYVEAAVYHAYLELVASEHAARMVAMHNATDSATELADAMTMELNKSRQAAITEEICDVSAGTEALSSGGERG